MRWLILLLALSACSTAVHECREQYPEPNSGFGIGMRTGGMSQGVLGGVITGILSGLYDDNRAEHQKWEQEMQKCVNQKKATNS